MEKSGFAAQGASQRMGTRGINIVTAKIKRSYAWPFEALAATGNGNVEVKQVAKKADAPPAQMIAPVAKHVQTPEPPPAVPMPEMNEVPPTATTEAAPIAAPATTTTPPKAVVDDPEPTGIHKNSREYRNWKSRQK